MDISGGPTAEARGILNLSIQYWTSRGWAFVDVNYGGSTGLFLTLPTKLYSDFLITYSFSPIFLFYVVRTGNILYLSLLVVFWPSLELKVIQYSLF